MKKLGWGIGPWSTEPDAVDWMTRVGLRGVILRDDELGTWAGYVGLPPGHPATLRDVDTLHAHGGVNFGPKESSRPKLRGSGLLWVGFDCAHAGDLVPAFFGRSRLVIGEYRNVTYVREQVEDLAYQLSRVLRAGAGVSPLN